MGKHWRTSSRHGPEHGHEMMYRMIMVAAMLVSCQAFAPPASGITRAMAVRNAASSVEMGAKKKPKKKPVKKQAKAQSDDSELFYHEGTKGFTGDPNAFVYKIGLSQ